TFVENVLVTRQSSTTVIVQYSGSETDLTTSVIGPGAAWYSAGPVACFAPQVGCGVEVIFKPPTWGRAPAAFLVVTEKENGRAATVELVGTGTRMEIRHARFEFGSRK